MRTLWILSLEPVVTSKLSVPSSYFRSLYCDPLNYLYNCTEFEEVFPSPFVKCLPGLLAYSRLLITRPRNTFLSPHHLLDYQLQDQVASPPTEGHGRIRYRPAAGPASRVQTEDQIDILTIGEAREICLSLPRGMVRGTDI